MKKPRTYNYKNEIAFNKAIAELDNIIDFHFNYQFNSGYIVVEEEVKTEVEADESDNRLLMPKC